MDDDSDHHFRPSADEDQRVLEWETGLPCADDLTPLSQPLISPELASAFSISPEPSRTLLDVHRASHNTMSSLRHQVSPNPTKLKQLHDPVVVVEDGVVSESEASKNGMEDSPMETEAENSNSPEDIWVSNSNTARASKRPRLAWTPELHKRFVEVVAHLGIKNSVPKTIMQLMNVEGLTRENVASHLQKYRLYLKRMQGGAAEGPSSPDNSREAVSYPAPPGMVPVPVQVPVPVYGGPIGPMPFGGNGAQSSYLHPYVMLGDRPREWPRGSG